VANCLYCGYAASDPGSVCPECGKAPLPAAAVHKQAQVLTASMCVLLVGYSALGAWLNFSNVYAFGNALEVMGVSIGRPRNMMWREWLADMWPLVAEGILDLTILVAVALLLAYLIPYRFKQPLGPAIRLLIAFAALSLLGDAGTFVWGLMP